MPTSAESFVARSTQLSTELAAQGTRVHALVELAFAALFTRDDAKARLVQKNDDAIDAADVVIEKNCVALLTDATRHGAELDEHHLRRVLTIVKVNNEMERIADAAVDIAELVTTGHAAKATASETFPQTFQMMANSVIGIVRDTNRAFAHTDAKTAEVVLKSQHTVTAFKAAVLRDAEARLAAGKVQPDFAFLLHEVGSMCEMIADHCTNIAEQVIYLASGSIVRHMEHAWVKVEGERG